MINVNDLYAIEAFNEEKVKAIFEGAYAKVFQKVAGAGVVSAHLIIDSITHSINPALQLMAIDAISEMEW